MLVWTIDIISDNELVIGKGSGEVELPAEGAIPQERTAAVQAALHQLLPNHDPRHLPHLHISHQKISN